VRHILVRTRAPKPIKDSAPSLKLLAWRTACCPVVGCSAVVGAATLEPVSDDVVVVAVVRKQT